MKRLVLSTALVVCAASAEAAPETYVIDNSRFSSQFSYRYLGLSSQTPDLKESAARWCSTAPPNPDRPM